MRIWLVSRGEYDSWEVAGLFEDERIDREAVAAGFGDDVEPYDIHEFVPEATTVYNAYTNWGKVGPARIGESRLWPDQMPADLDVLHVSGSTIEPAWWCRSTDREKAAALVETARDDAHRNWGKP